MKKSIILTLLYIVCCNLNIVAQHKSYTNEWLAIENLEVDGKVTSALEKVTSLHKKALDNKNTEQQLKTLLFRWKFLQIIDEKSPEKILQEIHSEIEKQASPNKEVLEMYLANFLETYMNSNFWNIKNRTATEKAALKDFRTWDLNTMLNQISLHYKNALTLPSKTSNVLTKNISELLITNTESRDYRSSVYDVIAHQALNFYTNSRNRVNKPKDEFLIDNAFYFDASATFVETKLQTTDTESLLFKAMQTYQQLEKTNNKNEQALI